MHRKACSAQCARRARASAHTNHLTAPLQAMPLITKSTYEAHHHTQDDTTRCADSRQVRILPHGCLLPHTCSTQPAPAHLPCVPAVAGVQATSRPPAGHQHQGTGPGAPYDHETNIHGTHHTHTPALPRGREASHGTPLLPQAGRQAAIMLPRRQQATRQTGPCHHGPEPTMALQLTMAAEKEKKSTAVRH